MNRATHLLQIIGVLLLLGIAAPAYSISIVIDFKQPGEAPSSDVVGGQVDVVNILQLGNLAQRNSVDSLTLGDRLESEVLGGINRIFAPVQNQLIAGFELNIRSGDIGGGTPMGSHWYLQVGERTDRNPNPVVGQVAFNSIRPRGNVFNQPTGTVIGSVFTDTLIGNSSSAPLSAQLFDELGDAWIMSIANSIAGTAAHEIGHALGLEHSSTLFGQAPVAFPDCGVGVMAIIDDYDERCRLRPRQFSATNIALLIDRLNQPEVGALILGNQPTPLRVEAEGISSSAQTVDSPSSLLLMLLATALLFSQWAKLRPD